MRQHHELRSGPRRGLPVLVGGVILLGCCASTPAMRTRSTDEVGDARVLLAEDHYSLAPDGARSHRVLSKTKIFTEYAVDELGDPRLVHNQTTQTLKVLRADTFMHDGKKVSIKPNSVTETTPGTLATAPAYADLRETVVTHVGVEVGSVNELEYELRTEASAAPLWAEVALHSPYPTDARVVTVLVPKGFPLRWACLGCEVTPSEKAVAGGTEHRFEWKGLPPLNTYEAGHHGQGLALEQPRLIFSTAASWKTLNDALALRFNRAATPDKAVQDRAEALTEGLVTEEQRLLALWRFVASEINTVDWSIDQLGFTPSPAATVLQRSYGHSLDKAVLLAALLQASGLRPVPALISRDGQLARKVPALAPFTETWLIVEAAGALRWLSPTALQPGDGIDLLEGRYALPLLDRSQKRMPFLIAKTPYALGEPVPIQTGGDGVARNTSALSAALSITDDGKVKGAFDLTLTGAYNPYVEVTADKGAAKVATGLLGGLGAGDWKSDCKGCGAKVLKLGTDSTAFALKAEGSHEGIERVLEIDLPFAARSQLLGADLHRGQRQTATALRSRGEERAVVTVAVPKGYALRSKLPVGEVKNAVGSLVTTSSQEGDEIKIERVLRIEKRVIHPAEYPMLRALADELWRADARSLLFSEAEPEPGA